MTQDERETKFFQPALPKPAARHIIRRMDLSLRTLLIPAIFGLSIASPALARDPAPPPSGIVIHLFGPGSITSNVLPAAPAANAAPSPAASAAAGVAASGSTTTSPASQPAYVEPTAGYILHQMFVTGDPNNPSKPSPGRVADRPSP